jgi:hypothetical protein
MNIDKRREYKQRYFDKKKLDAKTISCACGCGEEISDIDDYGREKRFASGHNNRRYNDGKTAKQRYYEKNTDVVKKRAQARKTPYARKIKVQFIYEKGGCCERCGLKYDGTNGVVFQFHHRGNKLFSLSSGAAYSHSLQKVRDEVDKCDLLCGNCHALHHHGGW